jgi:isoquinoline 1-oxidoreductase beta subunit
VLTGDYRALLGVHAAAEPPAATAELADGTLRLWIATQAPAAVRRAAAAAAGLAEDAVIVHPMLGAGGFGDGYEVELAGQAAHLALQLKRPVQVRWSRVEEILQDNYRPAASARMAARLDDRGRILGWQAKIAVPATVRQLRARMGGMAAHAALVDSRTEADALAIEGAVPPYAVGAFAIDHHPADIGVPAGYWRGGGHALTSFFTECFIDELARARGLDPFDFRLPLLAGERRLAHCLSTVAALGGWDGGGAGSHHGIACHSMRGSHVALFAQAHLEGARRIKVDRLIAVVDCGRLIHPELVRQQVESGLVTGMADALGMATDIEGGLATVRRLRDLAMPRLADMPEIQVELVVSDAAPGGASDIVSPVVAPAIANALRAATGRRARTLPLIMMEDAE